MPMIKFLPPTTLQSAQPSVGSIKRTGTYRKTFSHRLRVMATLLPGMVRICVDRICQVFEGRLHALESRKYGDTMGLHVGIGFKCCDRRDSNFANLSVQARNTLAKGDQQCIETAQAEFRAVRTYLKAELKDTKLQVIEAALTRIICAHDHIKELNHQLELTIHRGDQQIESDAQEKKVRIHEMKLRQKEIDKEMDALRQKSSAIGIDAPLDPATAAKKARFFELQQLSTSLCEQIEFTFRELEGLIKNNKLQQSDLRFLAESELIDLQEEIRTHRSDLDQSLKQCDDAYEANITREIARISGEFAIRFGDSAEHDIKRCDGVTKQPQLSETL